MSSSPIDTYPNNNNAGLVSQRHEDLGTDFFDQFMTFSPTDNEEKNYTDLQNSTFVQSTSGYNQSADISLDSRGHETGDSTRQDQTGGSLGGYCSTTMHNNPTCAEPSGKAGLSDLEVPSLERITLDSPQAFTFSQPPVPPFSYYDIATFQREKHGAPETFSKTFQKASRNHERNHRNPIRKASSLPKMLRAPCRSNSDLWASKLEYSMPGTDFADQRASLSSLVPNTFLDHSEESSLTKFGMENRACGGDVAQHFDTEPFDFEEPLPDPIFDFDPVKKESCERQMSSNVSFSPTPQPECRINEWPQMSSPPVPNPNGSPSVYSSGPDSPLWWNHAATAPMAQPIPTGLHANPRRGMKSVAAQLQNDLSFSPMSMPSGMMLQMPEVPVDQSFGLESSIFQDIPSQSYAPYHVRSRQHANTSSPKHLRTTSPVRIPQMGRYQSNSPSPGSSPERQVRKRKSQRLNKQSTPRTPSAVRSADFVNFTPDDSQKLLTGVAPSGSSKTKARREKEAMEKRRKLSQAAVRAVRAAGGDVESLAEEGIFI